MWEEMSLYKKHWMRTLPEVFYPALAAVGVDFQLVGDQQTKNVLLFYGFKDGFQL